MSPRLLSLSETSNEVKREADHEDFSGFVVADAASSANSESPHPISRLGSALVGGRSR